MELATQLVALKEGTDQLNSVERIHELLIPFEYTKLGKIIEIPFTVTEGAKSAFQDEQAPNTEDCQRRYRNRRYKAAPDVSRPDCKGPGAHH
jgi:hypothetical protein